MFVHIVGTLAKERVAQMMPSPPKEEPLNTPNVLLIYSQKVRPVCYEIRNYTWWIGGTLTLLLRLGPS